MSFEYNDETFKKIQNVELEMLKEVDRICRKYDIIYELDGGTLLGAVRYGGFIPWDDDIDIRMLRKDYDKFCDVCQNEFGEKYFWQTYHTDPGYRWEYGRVLKNNTKFFRDDHEMIKSRNGIFLDIFPCDNMPGKGLSKSIFNLRSFIARKIGYSVVGARYEKNILKKIAYKLLALIPMKLVAKEYDKLSQKYAGTETKYVRTTGWHWKQESKGYLRSWLTDYEEIKFEDMVAFAPKDTDGFLRYMYGDDYMTPPPVDKRKPQHLATLIEFGEE
jgi:lipopolysaccharide cholinephosphotransferase